MAVQSHDGQLESVVVMNNNKQTSAWFVLELRKLLVIGGPMIFVNIFSYTIKLISVMFVGHLDNGDLWLSRSSMATSIANVVGVSVLVRLCLLCTFTHPF